MQQLISALLCVIALVVACHGFGLGNSRKAGEANKEPKKAVSEEKGQGKQDKFGEIEKNSAKNEALIVELGDKNYAVRENAFRILSKTPSALPILRRFLKDNDPERRTRVEALVKDFSHRQFKALLRETAGRKDGVPLDLMVDIVTEWKDQMDKEDWRIFFGAIASVQTELVKGSRFKPRDLPDPTGEFIDHPVTSAEYLLRGVQGTVNRLKVVGEKTASHHIVSYCAVVERKTIEFDYYGGNGLFLANGNITIRGCSAAFVFCGADFTCEGGMSNCVVIARGKLKGSKVEDCIVLDESVPASRKYLFSIKMVGLALSPRGKAFRVDTVFDGSRAAKSGFEPGDLIIPNDFSGNDLPSLEEFLRRGLAKQTELVFRVERKGTTHLRVLSTFDN